jgi:hypothetical protein
MAFRVIMISALFAVSTMALTGFVFTNPSVLHTQSTVATDTSLSPATFRQPPSQYGIRCWWWWLNGNVTKEAITRDLEAMKAKGFSGACIVDAGGQNQQGNGNVPEGPMFGTPAWRELFTHAVTEAHRLGLVLSLSIQSGWNLGGPDVTPAEATKHITWSEITVAGPLKKYQTLPKPISKDNFYKDIVVIAFPKRSIPATRQPIRDLAVKAAFKEGSRSGYDTEKLLEDVPASPGEEDTAIKDIIVLQSKLDASGKLRWHVPAGNWTIMRFGYTTSGAEVSTSSGKWQGRVIDYMNERYFNRYWNTHVEPLLKDIGPLAGTTLTHLQTDSWECGGINWSDNFAAEFRKRRGYDIYTYLPIVAGKILHNRQTSNAFLADFRKTIGDCIAEHHYRVFAEHAAKHNMGIQPESAGPHAGPLDGLKNYSYNDIMLSEFWSPSPHRSKIEERFFVKQASSAAHIYNKRLVAAESFTTIGRHWNDIPWATMKPAFDHEVCSGLNLVLLHTFTCSPKEMGLPGQEYFAGTHINPNITWWEHANGFFDYLKRCQYIMQQPGNTVTDVVYYYGDHVPNIGHLKEDDPAHILPGYDYDLINEDRLQALTVHNGKLALPHGTTYRLLVIPANKILSLTALRKIKTLVTNGAVVVGPKPEDMISLSNRQKSMEEFRRLTGELWGNSIATAGVHKVGKGKVVWGQSARNVLAAMNIQPDFEITENPANGAFDYIHRSIQENDIYFISSQNENETSATFSFRVSGKQPEFWNAVTGEVKTVKAFQQQDDRTIIPVQFDPYGSVFVVFRDDIPSSVKGVVSDNAWHYKTATTLKGPWQVKFDNLRMGTPAFVTFDTLTSWTKRKEPGVANYAGKAIYTTSFDFPSYKENVRYFLELGNVQDVGIARVRFNNEDLGILWTPPFRIEITKPLRAKANQLQVEVTNSWRNRLVGDRGLSAEKRYTKTNITIKPEWTLLDAGLLGPVKITTISP